MRSFFMEIKWHTVAIPQLWLGLPDEGWKLCFGKVFGDSYRYYPGKLKNSPLLPKIQFTIFGSIT